MSHTHPTAASSSSSPSFQLIINNALDTYKKRTRNDLLAHPLVEQLKICSSPTAILAVFQQQVQGLDQSDERWTRWLDPTINVLYTFSNILGAGVSLVRFRTYNSLKLSHIYVAGILPCERHLCRRWGPPFSAYILANFTWAIVTYGYLRQLKTFEQATTLLLTYSSELKHFFDVLTYTEKRHRQREC